MNSVISVVTINLNNAVGLKNTLSSLEKNRDINTEIIIVDGGSKDNSIEYINQYEPIISKSIVEEDKGIYDAMNKGLNAASGGWIIFINSGDELRCNLADIRSYLNDSLRFVYGQTVVKNSKGKLFIWGRKFKKPIDIIVSPPFFHQSIFYKKEFIEKFSMDYEIIADRVMTYNIVKDQNENAWKFINQQIANFWDGGVSSISLDRIIKEEERFLRQYGLLTKKTQIKLFLKKVILNIKSAIQHTPIFTPIRKIWWSLRSFH